MLHPILSANMGKRLLKEPELDILHRLSLLHSLAPVEASKFLEQSTLSVLLPKPVLKIVQAIILVISIRIFFIVTVYADL